MVRSELELWSEGPRIPLPDKPSDVSRALAWFGGVLAGIGVLGAACWLLFYYLPWRARSCDHGYNKYDQQFDIPGSCHRVMNDSFASVFDGIGIAVVFTLLMVGLTMGLRNLRR
jgi:hypothetical protein